MKLNGILLPLMALAGLACASDSPATKPAPTPAKKPGATEAVAAKLPEVRYYVIADT